MKDLSEARYEMAKQQELTLSVKDLLADQYRYKPLEPILPEKDLLVDQYKRLDPILPVKDFSQRHVGSFNRETGSFTPLTPFIDTGINQYLKVEPLRPMNVDGCGNIHGSPRFVQTDHGWQPGSDIVGRMSPGGMVQPPIHIDPGPSYMPEPPRMELPPDMLP